MVKDTLPWPRIPAPRPKENPQVTLEKLRAVVAVVVAELYHADPDMLDRQQLWDAMESLRSEIGLDPKWLEKA